MTWSLSMRMKARGRHVDLLNVKDFFKILDDDRYSCLRGPHYLVPAFAKNPPGTSRTWGILWVGLLADFLNLGDISGNHFHVGVFAPPDPAILLEFQAHLATFAIQVLHLAFQGTNGYSIPGCELNPIERPRRDFRPVCFERTLKGS